MPITKRECFTHHVTVRLTESSYKRLKAIAKESKVSVADVVRSSLEKLAKKSAMTVGEVVRESIKASL